MNKTNIRRELGKSDPANTVEQFYDNILKYSGRTTKINNELWANEYTKLYKSITKRTIIPNVFDDSYTVDFPNIILQICDDLEMQSPKNSPTKSTLGTLCNGVDNICYDLLNFYFKKYANYVSAHFQGNTGYAISGIAIYMRGVKYGHQLSLVISKEDKKITLFDPNTHLSCETEEENEEPFQIALLKMYDILKFADIKLDNGDIYRVICPCSENIIGLQTLLSYNTKRRKLHIREGSCIIISLLIAHIMVYTCADPYTVINQIMECINHKDRKRKRVVFADSYLQFLLETRESDDTTNDDIMLRFSRNSMLRGLYEHLKDNMVITPKIYDDLKLINILSLDFVNAKIPVNRVVPKERKLDIRHIKTNIEQIIQRICGTRTVTFTWCNEKYTYRIGKFRFEHQKNTYFFNIFIDSTNIWIHESDNKIKLLVSLLTPTEVNIDTYYANKNGGPNLDVLRKMLKQFTKVHITLDTKIRTDDYQDIPYGLWPFVKYSASQFYNKPVTLNVDSHLLHNAIGTIGMHYANFCDININTLTDDNNRYSIDNICSAIQHKDSSSSNSNSNSTRLKHIVEHIKDDLKYDYNNFIYDNNHDNLLFQYTGLNWLAIKLNSLPPFKSSSGGKMYLMKTGKQSYLKKK